MADTDIQSIIHGVIKDVFEDHVAGVDFPELKPDTVLLNTGLDSLGFAIIVTQLEEDLGYDPFTIAEEAFYPNTYKEFVDFYIQNKP